MKPRGCYPRLTRGESRKSEMFGVILWSDEQSGAAVVWCEHSAQIAYFESPVPELGGKATPEILRLDAGDLVQFDICGLKGTRLEVTNLAAAGDYRQAMPSVEPNQSSQEIVRAECNRPAPLIDLAPRRGLGKNVA